MLESKLCTKVIKKTSNFERLVSTNYVFRKNTKPVSALNLVLLFQESITDRNKKKINAQLPNKTKKKTNNFFAYD